MKENSVWEAMAEALLSPKNHTWHNQTWTNLCLTSLQTWSNTRLQVVSLTQALGVIGGSPWSWRSLDTFFGFTQSSLLSSLKERVYINFNFLKSMCYQELIITRSATVEQWKIYGVLFAWNLYSLIIVYIHAWPYGSYNNCQIRKFFNTQRGRNILCDYHCAIGRCTLFVMVSSWCYLRCFAESDKADLASKAKYSSTSPLATINSS